MLKRETVNTDTKTLNTVTETVTYTDGGNTLSKVTKTVTDNTVTTQTVTTDAVGNTKTLTEVITTDANDTPLNTVTEKVITDANDNTVTLSKDWNKVSIDATNSKE